MPDFGTELCLLDNRTLHLPTETAGSIRKNLVNINPATAAIHDLHGFLAFRISVLVNEPCQDGIPQTQRVLCVLLLSRATFGGA